jgi:hypothetical protein
MRFLLPSFVLALLLSVSCDRSESKPEKPRRLGPVPLSQAMISEVVPVADGGAYMRAFGSGLWYVRGTEAVKVSFEGSVPQTEGAGYLSLELVPTVDGGAYAISRFNHHIWYLKAGEGRRVKEVTSLTSNGNVPGESAKFFALYIAQLSKGRAATDDYVPDEAEERPQEY